MNGLSPASSAAATDPALVANAILAADGEGSGVDADKLRGRDGATASFRLSFAPALTPPPGFGEVAAATLFGV